MYQWKIRQKENTGAQLFVTKILNFPVILDGSQKTISETHYLSELWATVPSKTTLFSFLPAGSRFHGTRPFPVMPDENFDITGRFGVTVPPPYVIAKKFTVAPQ